MRLIECSPEFEERIADYSLQDTTYTGAPKDAITVSKKNGKYHSILCVTEGNEIPTFFVLDSGDDKFRYTADSRSLLLRSFSTDDRFVRKGYALEALRLLPAYISARFPETDQVVLGVNERNSAAQQLYEKAQFIRQNRVYQGRLGRQLIYCRYIITSER
ncbi:GNAT family N-acetyltransferase [Bifidobacterium aquikefiri]|uniref:GNAT family N-acetyltransferase n=1 Tax=Bifidobacterium aquikefiri TaxID=1653207 RepID=UPI0023EFF0CB|nr:GNAT family protein [Bifidobacterium aquikefiri]